jgi:hypothetical protein
LFARYFFPRGKRENKMSKPVEVEEWWKSLEMCISNIKSDLDLLEDSSNPRHRGRYEYAKLSVEHGIDNLTKMLKAGPKVAK